MQNQQKQIKLIGNQFFVDWLNEKIPLLKQGQGAVLFIDGEVGYGKSHLLNYAQEYCNTYYKNLKTIYIETQSPIGSISIGAVQPLQPFHRAIEGIAKSDNLDPKIKLIKNIALTTLSAIPFLGDIPYILKELPRDFENYKREVEKNNPENKNTIIDYYYNLLLKNIEKKEILLLFDDMHWCDSQSIELLKLIIKNINKIPILIIITYRRNLVEIQGLPFLTLLKSNIDSDNISFVRLKPFEIEHINKLCNIFFKNYKPNSEFEEWILEKTGGTPAVVNEYLNYFSLYPPFDENGNLVTNFKDNEFLPDSIQSLFSQYIEILNEDEKNILTICSAEGLEFTVFIISKLIDCDLVTTIKKLRSIQNKTGFIKSIGAMNKYGIKTTVYKFTQVFYHNFFENLLEYEEKVEIHSRIADLLKEQFKNADNDLIKSEIAPYIAAHCLVSGDQLTAQEMLINSLELSKDYTSKEMIGELINTFDLINPSSNEIKEKLEKLKKINSNDFTIEANSYNNTLDYDIADSLIDFKSISKSAINDILNNDYDKAKNKINKFLELKINTISKDEEMYLLSMLAKINIDIGKFEDAKLNLENAEKLIFDINDKNTLAFYNNTYTLYFYYQGNYDKAKSFIEKNINQLHFLNDETKLLTLSIISLIIKKLQPEEFKKFKEMAIKQSSELNFDTLKIELNKI